MKKKETEQAIRELAQKVIKEVNEEKELEFNTTRSLMDIAESKLVQTFDEKQYEMYEDFCKRRKAFYTIAGDIYIKRF